MDGTVEQSRPNVLPGPGPGFTEQSLWSRLTAAGTLEAVAEAWCPLLAAQIDGAVSVCVLARPPEGGPLRSLAVWPQSRLPAADAIAAAEAAIDNVRGVVRSPDRQSNADTIHIAAPFVLDGSPGGAAVLEFSGSGEAAIRTAMRQLQWGAAWLRDALRAGIAEADRNGFAAVGHALHVVVAAAECEGYEASCRAAATELAARFDCDRVAIGSRAFRRSKVRAISHTAQFGRRMSLVRLLAAAMDEAIDQRGLVLYPERGAEEIIATGAARALAQDTGAGHVLSVPLFAADRYVGAAVFERPAGRGFDPREIEMLEAAVTTLAPVLEEKRRNDRWLIVKLFSVIGAQLGRLFGPGRIMRKIVVLAAVAILAFFYFARAEYRVTADAAVEGAVQRAVVAAYDGFVAEAPARAGDRVSAGDLLVRLDDRDLALERLRLVTERQRITLEYEQAIAARDRAEARIKQTQIEQAEAEIELVDARLERVRLEAPFDGLVVSGDLSQSIGAAVQRGEVLLEIAPLDAYRVALQVDERSVADVAPGQVGSLLVSALPETPIPIRVEKITPVADYGDGRTTFRVEASLTEVTPRLRPGMEGVAKIDVDRRRLLAIWTKPAVDWARVWSWRWLEW